jgi:predicted flap endonuclease-1-like 5' DNA nuclease
MVNLEKVEGIGPIFANKLKQAGVATADALLQKAATPQGRQSLAAATGISRKHILEWVNLVDLFRVQGIEEEYSDLLEEAGVDTIVELATRHPSNLYERLLMVNEAENLVNRLPSEADVEKWIDQAKNLPRKIQY